MSSMRLLAVVAGLGAIWGAADPAQAAAVSADTSPSDAQQSNWQTVENYCVHCHNTTDWAGKIAFDTLSPDGVPQESKIWEAAVKKLRSGLMPPPAEKQPDRAAVQSMIKWLETTLDKAQESSPHTGYVPLRRLNRREYANSVHDLLGLQLDAAQWLPQDPVKDDFDNNAEQLQMNASFMDQAVDFTKFCPIRQQLMSNCLCAVRFRPYSGHRSNMNDDSPAANALGAVPTTDGLPGRLEQTVLPGALAA